MRYYILAPIGRTGSRRIQQLLNFKNKFFSEYSLHILPRYVSVEFGETTPDTVEFWTSKFDFAAEKEIKTYTEVQEILRTSPDGCTVHSHSMMPIPDLENWTVIHSIRKSKAEQIMSWSIAKNINSYSPLSKDIKFEPYAMKKEDVLEWHKNILVLDEKVKEMFSDCIEIFLEDDYKQIQEKLKITFDADTLNAIDKAMVSNHRYPDLITNYLDVFKWCGEEPPV
jgi:hypothetical protein